jgi:hypothetical protein
LTTDGESRKQSRRCSEAVIAARNATFFSDMAKKAAACEPQLELQI